MSESSSPQSPSTDDLQFTNVELGASDVPQAQSGPSCAICHQPIRSTYFALGDQTLCPACCELVNAAPTGSRLGRVVKAILLGSAAGLLGAVIWFAIRRIAHLEIGLVAILVGWMVGKAVRRGSGGRGGRGYQALAVAMTYCFVAVNYMPDILHDIVKAHQERAAKAAVDAPADAKPQPEPVQSDAADRVAADPAPAPRPEMGLGATILGIALLLVLAFTLALAAPFLAGMSNVIGLLIIGFALWEAWKLNAHRPLPISGPYQISAAPGA